MFRDHIVTTTPITNSHTHLNGSSRSHSNNNGAKVYSTLLRHRNIICAERLKTNTKERETTTGTAVTNTQDSIDHELCLLQNEERKPQSLPARSSHHAISRTHSVDGHSSVHRSTSRSNSVPRQQNQQIQGQYVARQQSHDYSELQEDEEEVVTNYQRLPVAAAHRSRRSRNVSARMKLLCVRLYSVTRWLIVCLVRCVFFRDTLPNMNLKRPVSLWNGFGTRQNHKG